MPFRDLIQVTKTLYVKKTGLGMYRPNGTIYIKDTMVYSEKSYSA